MPTDGWIKKHTGILLSLKKGGNSVIRDNMDETGGHYIIEKCQTEKDNDPFICGILLFFSFLSSPKDMLIDSTQRGRKGEGGEEKHQCERITNRFREKH